MIITRLGQIGVGVGRYLGFLPKTPPASVVLLPNPARTITVLARLRALVALARNLKITVPARARHFIVREDMIYQADNMRPGESPVFSLDIRKELAITDDEITSVTAALEVEDGVDDDVAGRLVGSASFTGTTISQRVSAVATVTSYNLKFNVVTPLQALEYVINIPVNADGAFE